MYAKLKLSVLRYFMFYITYAVTTCTTMYTNILTVEQIIHCVHRSIRCVRKYNYRTLSYKIYEAS